MPNCHFLFCRGVSKEQQEQAFEALEMHPTCRALKRSGSGELFLACSDDVEIEETIDGFALSFGLTLEDRYNLKKNHFAQNYKSSSQLADKSQWLYLFHHKVRQETWLVTNCSETWPVFIHHEEEKLMLSSEPQPLIATQSPGFNPRAILEFLSFGFTLDSKTIFQNINLLPAKCSLHFKDSALKTFASYSTQGLTQQLSFDEKVERFHLIFTKVLEEKFNQQGLTHMTLTGGSDSRLMLFATPEIIRKEKTYWFDHECGISLAEVEEELEAIRPLVDQLKLNFHLGYPDQKSFPPFLIEQAGSDRYRAFDADFHSQTLTGIYGTELLSGACLNLRARFEQDSLSREELTETAQAWQTEIKNQFQGNLGTNQLAPLATLTYHSFLTDLYQDPIWGHPWIQAKRKPTPFLHPEMLSFLLSLKASDTENYRFTYHYLKRFFPQALKTPFASSFNFHYELPKLSQKRAQIVNEKKKSKNQLTENELKRLGEILCELQIFAPKKIEETMKRPDLQYRYFLLGRWYLLARTSR